MLNFLKRAVLPGRVPAGVVGRLVPGLPVHTGAHLSIDVPRYPPSDPGLPAAPVPAIVASQRELIERLRRVAGFDDTTFESRCLAPIQGVARYVHLLPATAFEHFAGAGGLFRYCVEMALFSRQAAEGRMFAHAASAEARRDLEPRWKYACFLAGLLSELHRPLAALVVTDPTGRVWPTFLGSLDAWLRAVQAERYHVAWQGRPPGLPASAEGAAVFGDIIPKGALAWLNEASPALVAEVFGTALGQAGTGGGVASVVGATRERVLHVEASTRRTRYGQLRVGHHLELHLVDAIRQRVAAGGWGANPRQGPLWFGADGLYLEWPVAAGAIRDDLMRNGTPGIPLCAFTLAEVLGRAGVLAEVSPGNWLWPICIGPCHDAAPPTRCSALKFAEPRSVLGYTDVQPAARRFHAVAEPGEHAVSSAPPQGLAPAEARMVDQWRQSLGDRRTDLLVWLPGRGLAVSQDLIALSGADLAAVATSLHRRHWLGRGDWPTPHARAGLLAFAGTLKPGLVLNEAGARQLGLAMPPT